VTITNKTTPITDISIQHSPSPPKRRRLSQSPTVVETLTTTMTTTTDVVPDSFALNVNTIVCQKCGEKIFAATDDGEAMLQMHMDEHMASELSRQLNNPRTILNNRTKKSSRPNAKMRKKKKGNRGKSISTFFVKK